MTVLLNPFVPSFLSLFLSICFSYDEAGLIIKGLFFPPTTEVASTENITLCANAALTLSFVDFSRVNCTGFWFWLLF